MTIRIATLDDYEEICEMYRELLYITYEGMEIGKKIHTDQCVYAWFMANRDINVTVSEDGEITGFTVAFIQNLMVVESYYYGDLAFVKEDFRRSRAAYLLYNAIVERAKILELPIMAKAYVGGGNKDQVDKIQSRWGVPIFTEYSSVGKN